MAAREAPLITGPGPWTANAITCRTGDARCQAASCKGAQAGGTRTRRYQQGPDEQMERGAGGIGHQPCDFRAPFDTSHPCTGGCTNATIGS